MFPMYYSYISSWFEIYSLVDRVSRDQISSRYTVPYESLCCVSLVFASSVQTIGF